jgi:hypothetical protein
VRRGEVAPEINVEVSTDRGEITVSDNGRGLPADTITDILDYSSRTSSREACVSPSRGAQGNALKTLLPMPHALHGTSGTTVIEARGERHIITKVDQLRQEPVIDHQRLPLVPHKSGTSITIGWPDSASSILADAKPRFLQIADDFGWLNPHLRIRVEWDSEIEVDRQPSAPAWKKWRGCDPTSAHWYDQQRLTRYLAAHVARDQDHGRNRTVREFITELRGFSGSATQKKPLDRTALTRSPLSTLFGSDGSADTDRIAALLSALKTLSKPPKPLDLGTLGKGHLLACFKAMGLETETFKYQKVAGVNADELPCVVETAFGWCPSLEQRRIVVGVNWSVALGNPFRSFGRTGEGLEYQLADARASSSEPVVFVLHFACPRIQYTDRGKSAIVLSGELR